MIEARTQRPLYRARENWQSKEVIRSALSVFPSPTQRTLRSGLYNCAIMAQALVGRSEKLRSETLLLYFCCTVSLFRLMLLQV